MLAKSDESEVVKDGKTWHDELFANHQCFEAGGRRGTVTQMGPGALVGRIVLTTYVTSQWARTRADPQAFRS